MTTSARKAKIIFLLPGNCLYYENGFLLLLRRKFKLESWEASGCGAVGRAAHPTPEIRGSIPGFGKKYLLSAVLNLCLNDENKEKDACNGPFLKLEI